MKNLKFKNFENLLKGFIANPPNPPTADAIRYMKEQMDKAIQEDIENARNATDNREDK